MVIQGLNLTYEQCFFLLFKVTDSIDHSQRYSHFSDNRIPIFQIPFPCSWHVLCLGFVETIVRHILQNKWGKLNVIIASLYFMNLCVVQNGYIDVG